MKKRTKRENCFSSKENRLELLLILLVFLITLVWSLRTFSPGGPDEPLRYMVAEYLYKHPFHLPNGFDIEIRDDIWGISYGFYPILSYMVSAVFMHIASLFSKSEEVLLHAARLADVFFVTGAAAVTLRVGKKLFQDERRWFFPILVIFLPEFVFLGTYVNTDSLALLASAVIALAWAGCLQEGWTVKNAVILAVGMGICFLSYYNAFGWILWSFFFFLITALFCEKGTMKERIRLLLQRGFLIAGITFLIAGWWYIRNLIIYDGDLLGSRSATECGEMYGQEAFKPSVHPTPEKLGFTWKQFFMHQDPGWDHNWTVMVVMTFVGAFGVYNIFLGEGINKLYVLFLLLGLFFVLLCLKEFRWHRKEQTVRRRPSPEVLSEKTVVRFAGIQKKAVFHLFMLLNIITSFVLLVYYAYYNDLQSQGRYIMPAVIPIMYFVSLGYGRLLELLVRRESIRKWFYRIVSVLWILGPVLCYLILIRPYY